MARKTIWDLSLEIAGKDKGASQAIRTIKKQLGDLNAAAGQVGKDWKAFTGNATKLALGVAGGVAAATAGVVAMANTFAETGDKVAKTSDRLGMGIEAYQGLSYAMQQSGLSAEEFDSALEKFNLTVRQGAAGNDAMAKQLLNVGLSAKKLAGMKPEQAMMELSEWMQALPSDAARTTAAVTLFGKAAGTKMMAAMKQGSAGMKELMKEAKSLGIVLSDEQARQSESFISARDRLKQSVVGMKNQFIGGAIGPLTEAFDHLKDAVVDQMPAIQELGAKFGQWLGDLVTKLPEIIAKIKEFATNVWDNVNKVKEFVGGWGNLAKIVAGIAIAPTLISGLKVVWSMAKFIKIAIAAIGPILSGLASGGFAALAAAAAPIIGIIAGIALAVYTVVKNFDKLKAYATECFGRIKAAFGVGKEGADDFTKAIGIIKKVLGVVMGILEGGMLFAIKTAMNLLTSAIQIVIGTFKVLWNVVKLILWPIETVIKVIIGLFTGGWAGAVDALGGQFTKLGAIYSGIFDGLKTIIGGVADLLKGQFKNAIEFVNKILGNLGLNIGSIGEGIRNGFSKFKEIAGEKINALAERFPIIGKAIELVKGRIEGLKNAFGFIFDTIKSIVGAFTTFFKDVFYNPVNAVKTLIGSLTDIFSNVFNVLKGKIESFVGFFTDKFSAVKDFFGGIGSAISGVFGGGKKTTVPGHAEGGIFRQPHIAQIAERGAEAVVPLNKTSQGFEIWKQAGELGGYLKKASEQTSTITAAAPAINAAASMKSPEPSPVTAAAAQKLSSGDTAVRIELKMTNNFNSGTPNAETVKQISEAGQKAGNDIEAQVRAIIASMKREERRLSYGV